jgi:Trk K+ transport system NAD-binding subunit
MLFLLVLLPFIFIEFFYQPWMAAQTAARTPRELKRGTRDHVLITHLDAVTATFMRRLERYHREYALLVPSADEGLRLQEEHGYRVVVGAVDDPETYRRLRVSDAAMVVATGSDSANTLVASTVREASDTARIVATADDTASIDILMLADCQEVLHLPSLMASALSRRVIGGDNRTHPIGSFDRLLIAEANASGTSLVDLAIKDTTVRAETGVSIVGVWDRGAFEPAAPDTVLSENSVLLLAGTEDQLAAYDAAYADRTDPQHRVLILGGGRIGYLTARSLDQRRIPYRVVERDPTRPGQDERWVIGNAAELSVLREAGIDEATTIIISTHDDDTNVYLSLYCRKLRPEAKILSRATDPRNVSSIHRAGADFVLSYASMGAVALFNSLDLGAVMVVADGLNLFRVDVPHALHGKRLVESAIRPRTGATVVAIETPDGQRMVNPSADAALARGSRLILIGDAECEQKFLEKFGS